MIRLSKKHFTVKFTDEQRQFVSDIINNRFYDGDKFLLSEHLKKGRKIDDFKVNPARSYHMHYNVELYEEFTIVFNSKYSQHYLYGFCMPLVWETNN